MIFHWKHIVYTILGLILGVQTWNICRPNGPTSLSVCSSTTTTAAKNGTERCDSPLQRRQSSSSSSSSNHSQQQRPKLNNKLLRNFLVDFIVLPEKKLLFCSMNKVGSKMFYHLFRMVRLLDTNIIEINEVEAMYQSQSFWASNTPSHHGMNQTSIEDILIDPSWRKVVFYRDPVTRFLSGYKDKCHHTWTPSCQRSFGGPPPSESNNNETMITFPYALYQLQTKSQQVFQDKHFAPQSNFCGGLKDTIQYYDSIHLFTKQTITQHVRQLLQTINVDTTTITYLLENVVPTGGTNKKKDLDIVQQRWPNITSLPLPRNDNYFLNVNENHTLRSFYQTNEMLQIVQNTYQEDYNVFSHPRWTINEIENHGV